MCEYRARDDLAQLIADPGQQVVAVVELLKGQYAWRCCLGDGSGELLQGLHDVRQATCRGVAQPAWQVFFQQQGVTGGQRALAAHQTEQCLLLVEQALDVLRVGRLIWLPCPAPGEHQALALNINQVTRLLRDHVLGKPFIPQAIGPLDQLPVLLAR